MKKGAKRQKTSFIVVRTLLIIVMALAAAAATLHIVKESFRPTATESPDDGENTSIFDQETHSEGDPLSANASSRRERKENCYTFLVAASDQSSGNADVIMVVMYDAGNQNVGIVSIPRDTLVDPSSVSSRFPKINSTYLHGVESLQSTVEDMLGIPLDYYMTFDTSGFVELIDTIGGIDFDVPVHMSYDDPTQDLSIHFEPGLQHLDGRDALRVCRLRYNNDGTLAYSDYDIGRTRTQQGIIKAAIKKALSQPWKFKEYLSIFSSYCSTDLSLGNLLWLADSAKNLDTAKIQSETLPGNGEVTCKNVKYCYQLYVDDTVDIVNRLINPYLTERTKQNLHIFTVK